jgi:hypothetical protein
MVACVWGDMYRKIKAQAEALSNHLGRNARTLFEKY